MYYPINRDSSKGILLAPQANQCSDLSYYKVEVFNLFNKLNYQQLVKLLIYVNGALITAWKILNILLWLWEHPRPYII